MISFWDDLYDLYGDTKASRDLGLIGEEVFLLWKEKISFIETDKLKVILPRVLILLENGSSDWPPNRQKFTCLCLQVRDDVFGNKKQRWWQGREPVVVDRSPNAPGREEIKKMKKMLALLEVQPSQQTD